MHTTILRKVGGSIMLAVPPAILDLLHLHAGATVGLAVERGRLVIEPHYARATVWTSCWLNATPRPSSARKIAHGWIASQSVASCCNGSRRYLPGITGPDFRP
jgi:antitoxin ChpS